MSPAVSVVIPTHNRRALLARVLQAYEAQSGDVPFELLVADDGSTDGTAAFLRGHQAHRYHLRPVILGENRGPGPARNDALAAAGAPLVIVAGDDILPSPDFVARHLAAHERHPAPHWAILGLTSWADDLPLNSLMRHIDGRGGQQFGYARLRDGQEVDFRHFYTSNISFKRGILDRLDRWFDPDFTYAAYEDAELAYRLTERCGLRIRFDAAARAGHSHAYGVRAFAERQYRCGLMAAVLLRKHPELRPRWRAERLRRAALATSLPPIRVFLEGLREEDMEAVEEAALALGTGCEALDGPVVDALYLALLEYFVLKGMLVGDLGPDQALRPRRALLLFGLLYYLGLLLEGPGGFRLADLDGDQALARTARHYDDIRRQWPRPLRWLALSPIRALILPAR
jgi:glycosyltransferase involved in cell wall biosynthesis